jgi:hypothetical protein
MLGMSRSEVAQIKERIAAEYMAARWGLSGLASGIPRHQFIVARMERMEEGRRELATMVGNQQAAMIMAETLASLPEQPERAYALDVIKHLLGDTEQTNCLLNRIQAMWETIDVLLQEFGPEDAYKIINASGPTLPDGE